MTTKKASSKENDIRVFNAQKDICIIASGVGC